MARMGHDSERAALIYQCQARGADKIIADSIDAHVEAEQRQGNDDDGPATALGRSANGPLMARTLINDPGTAPVEHSKTRP